MKTRSTTALFAAGALGLVMFSARPAAAQGTEVHAFVSNGMKAVIDDLRPQLERALGHPLAFQFGTTTGLKQRIEAGENFDVTVLTSEAVADLLKEGELAADSRTDLARCGIGVGMRTGASKPDIRTPGALKQALHNAKSITFARDGASRVYLEQMFQRFGIGDEMKAKTLLESGSVAANARVQAGGAEYILTLVSEILPAPGVTLVGPLPGEVQNYVNFSGGVSAKASNAAAAKALLRFLKGSAAAPVYQAKGMEPR